MSDGSVHKGGAQNVTFHKYKRYDLHKLLKSADTLFCGAFWKYLQKYVLDVTGHRCPMLHPQQHRQRRHSDLENANAMGRIRAIYVVGVDPYSVALEITCLGPHLHSKWSIYHMDHMCIECVIFWHPIHMCYQAVLCRFSGTEISAFFTEIFFFYISVVILNSSLLPNI